MKELFTEKRFTGESERLLRHIDSVLEDYTSQGYDLSLRQLYYQLVAANIIPNSERSYKNIGSLVSNARVAGLIDWDCISDRGRNTLSNSHWEKPREILDACAQQFQIDKWKNQPCYVEVMVEKQALEGILAPVCRDLDISFTANKGYSSSSAIYRASKRLLRRAEAGKKIYVLYLGDHDPSGIDMTRDITDRLDLFVNTSLGEIADLQVDRLALNMNQIKKMKPPENPAKLSDSRAHEYIRRFGKSSWELDAIEPKALAKLVRKAVEKIRVEDLWLEAIAIEDSMRSELKKSADKSKF